jgi:hypothetical protein
MLDWGFEVEGKGDEDEEGEEEEEEEGTLVIERFYGPRLVTLEDFIRAHDSFYHWFTFVIHVNYHHEAWITVS